MTGKPWGRPSAPKQQSTSHQQSGPQQSGGYPRERQASGSGQNDIAEFMDAMVGIIEKLMGPSVSGRKPPQVEVLTYQDAITYFVNEHPGIPEVEAGAMLSRPHGRGHLIFQVFLGSGDRVCIKPNGDAYGRSLVAQHLDAELVAAFDGQDLIVFR